MTEAPKEIRLPMGVVLRRRPGVTRWAGEVWQATAVLPGAGPADYALLREDGDSAEYHAATLPLVLHRKEVEGYQVSLEMTPPSVFVILRPGAERPLVHAVTASAYEAQDHTDTTEDQVEPVTMPPSLVEAVQGFVDAHWDDAPFIKRKRDRKRVDLAEDGIGDARIRQTADVYRAPGALKPGRSG